MRINRDGSRRSGSAQDLQGELTPMDFFKQAGGGLHAAPAARPDAGAHGELGHGPAAGLRGVADVVVGHSVADADVHGDGRSRSRIAAVVIRLWMRMIVNQET